MMNKIIYGIHAVQAVLERDSSCFQSVSILEKCKNRRLLLLINALKSQGITTRLVNRNYLDKQSKGATHQGIVATIKYSHLYREKDLMNLIQSYSIPFLLILDGITDPHNLGACLRSADAAGIHAIIIPKDRSAQLNAIARKVACGAAENVPLIRVTNLVRTIHMLQSRNIWIIGTDQKVHRTIYQSKLTNHIALVVGAEDKGMRRLTRQHCDELVSIPMLGIVSSLNVSVATGICLFEAVRQRNEKHNVRCSCFK